MQHILEPVYYIEDNSEDEDDIMSSTGDINRGNMTIPFYVGDHGTDIGSGSLPSSQEIIDGGSKIVKLKKKSKKKHKKRINTKNKKIKVKKQKTKHKKIKKKKTKQKNNFTKHKLKRFI